GAERRQSPVSGALQAFVIRIVGVAFDEDSVEELGALMLFDRRRNDFADRQRLGLVLLLDLIGASVEAQGIIRDADDRTVLGNDDLDALRLELVLDLIKHVFANGLRFAGVRDLLAEVIGLSF